MQAPVGPPPSGVFFLPPGQPRPLFFLLKFIANSAAGEAARKIRGNFRPVFLLKIFLNLHRKERDRRPKNGENPKTAKNGKSPKTAKNGKRKTQENKKIPAPKIQKSRNA